MPNKYVVLWRRISRIPITRAADIEKSVFFHTAAGVGNCAIFLRDKDEWGGLHNMSNPSNYVRYEEMQETSDLGSCYGLSGTVQIALSCIDGVDTWTTTKDYCPEFFCPNATIVWVATYSEADGLGLTVVQSRSCAKEESCAAGGGGDNDEHSHSDGAAATGPLAALLVAAITILIAL